MREPIVKPVASRTFRNKKTGKPVVADVYRPRQVAEDEWTCRLVIRGLPEPCRHEVHGGDALQALSLAIEGIRYYLDQSGQPITAFGGEVGEYFIYRPLMGFDVAMTRHLEALVQKEITKLVQAKVRARRRAKARAKQKTTGKSAAKKSIRGPAGKHR